MLRHDVRRGARRRLWAGGALPCVSLGGGHRLNRVFRPPAARPSLTVTLQGMARIETSTIPSGLPIHRIELPGTRATTVLVAFDAGARTERREENGMAHFL